MVNKLYIMQKKMLIIIAGVCHDFPSATLFCEFSCLTIFNLNKLRLNLFCFKRQNCNFSPFLDTLPLNTDIIPRNVRKGRSIFIPNCKFSRSFFMPNIAMAKAYNDLPVNDASTYCFHSFKKMCIDLYLKPP